MTLDIERLRAVIAAATPGPWRTHRPGMSAGDRICGWDGGDEYAEGPSGGFWSTGPNVWEKERALADAEFIAAARTALPAALDEIERLRAEVAGLRSTETELTRMLGSVETDYEACCVDRDAIRARLAELSNIVDRQRDDLLQRDETLALIERNEPVRAFFTLAQVMREVRAANARLAEVERERDELRSALAGAEGENVGLRVLDGFFQRRCALLEAAAVRKLTSTETDAFKGCCPLCGLTVIEHCAESARLAERDTAEQIAAWLESERRRYAEEATAWAMSVHGGRAAGAHEATIRILADIRAGAWRKERT